MNYNHKIDLGQKAHELEQQVISKALFSPEMVRFVVEIDPADFIDEDLREVKIIMEKMYSEKKFISPTTICNETNSRRIKDTVTSLAVLAFYGDPDTLFTQFNKYHRMVNLEPDIIRLADMVQTGDNDFDEKFEEVSDKFSASKVTMEAVKMNELFKKKPEEVKEKFVRFKTGIPSLDDKIKWLYCGQYICIAAKPGAGKTTLGGQIAENITNSLFMSYEMLAEEFHDILLSRKTNIDSEKIEDDNLDTFERHRLETARRELAEECTLLINDVPLKASDMFAFIKVQVKRKGVKCVVIDYAQIIPGLPGKGNQTEKYEWLSRKFKLLARELNIVVIVLSQLTKDSVRDGRAPDLSDLRGSLSFGSDADKVIFLYDIPDEYGIGSGEPQMSLGKNRKGKIGKVKDFFYNKATHFMR